MSRYVPFHEMEPFRPIDIAMMHYTSGKPIIDQMIKSAKLTRLHPEWVRKAKRKSNKARKERLAKFLK